MHMMRKVAVTLLMVHIVLGKLLGTYGENDAKDQVNINAEALTDGILSYAKFKTTGSGLPVRIDLALILDSSSAVGDQQNFKSIQKFARRLVAEFSISPSTTRVGVICCSSNPYVQFSLDTFVNRECTLKALKRNRYPRRSHCSIPRALDLTRRVLFNKNYENAKQVVFMIMDGRGHRGGYRASSAAKALKNKQAEIFLLWIGKNDAQDENEIASKPLELHSLHVRNYKELIKLSDLIRDKGLDRSCNKEEVVYDECNRRCTCSSDGRMVNCHRVRKDFQSMALEERRLYIHALKTVSTLQPYKKIYDEMTSYHPRWFKEVHRLKYFFPWHRWYILKFENFLRRIDCRVTVPYWDWSRAVSKGSLWRASHIRDVWNPGPHGIGGNGRGKYKCVLSGPFAKNYWSVCYILRGLQEYCLSREFNSCFSERLPGEKEIQSLLNLPYESFVHFERNVRAFIHDDFHNAIGGVMSFEESANAPEFWFHHGFLDKLWGDWQKRGYSYKHQYFHGVDTVLPGANVSGSLYIDLSNQPMCVKVIQDNPIDIKEKREEFDQSINDPQPINRC